MIFLLQAFPRQRLFFFFLHVLLCLFPAHGVHAFEAIVPQFFSGCARIFPLKGETPSLRLLFERLRRKTFPRCNIWLLHGAHPAPTTPNLCSISCFHATVRFVRVLAKFDTLSFARFFFSRTALDRRSALPKIERAAFSFHPFFLCSLTKLPT